MNELGLPDPPPLAADVRARAGARVLDGLDARPGTRRWGPVLAAAAVVVVALVASTVVAITGFGGERTVPTLLPAGQPALSRDTVADNALLRCAAAANVSPDRAAWPPTGTWHTTDVLLASATGTPESEVAIAVNDAFTCFVGGSQVWVSATSGPAVGPVQAVRLTPAIVALLNPRRQSLQVVPDALERAGRPDAPVQLLLLGAAGMRTSDFRLTVAGIDAGPLPEPAPIAFVAQDRPSLSRAPESPGTSLQHCLAAALPGARTLVAHGATTGPAAIAGTADGHYAGVCVDGPHGPVFRGADVPAGATTRVVVAPPPAALGAAAALLAVPDTVTRVEIATVPRPGVTGAGAACTLGGGFALCTLATTAPVTVTVYTGSTATTIALP